MCYVIDACALGKRELLEENVLLYSEAALALAAGDVDGPPFVVHLEAFLLRQELFDVAHHSHDVLTRLFFRFVRHSYRALERGLDCKLAVKLVFLKNKLLLLLLLSVCH